MFIPGSRASGASSIVPLMSTTMPSSVFTASQGGSSAAVGLPSSSVSACRPPMRSCSSEKPKSSLARRLYSTLPSGVTSRSSPATCSSISGCASGNATSASRVSSLSNPHRRPFTPASRKPLAVTSKEYLKPFSPRSSASTWPSSPNLPQALFSTPSHSASKITFEPAMTSISPAGFTSSFSPSPVCSGARMRSTEETIFGRS